MANAKLLEKRVSTLESNSYGFESNTQNLSNQVGILENKINRLESALNRQNKTFEERMNRRFKSADHQIKYMHQKIERLSETVFNIRFFGGLIFVCSLIIIFHFI